MPCATRSDGQALGAPEHAPLHVCPGQQQWACVSTVATRPPSHAGRGAHASAVAMKAWGQLVGAPMHALCTVDQICPGQQQWCCDSALTAIPSAHAHVSPPATKLSGHVGVPMHATRVADQTWPA